MEASNSVNAIPSKSGLLLGLGIMTALAAGMAGLGYYFFTRSPSDPLPALSHAKDVTGKESSGYGKESQTEFPPLFQDWPKAKPDLALVLSGEMFGYLRPCGCSPGQHGGLARRGGFLDYLRDEKGWNTLPIDLGDLIGQSTNWESIRYAHALESLKKLGYPVIGVGVKDMAITVMEVLGQAMNLEGTNLVNANLRHSDPDFQSLLDEGFKKVVLLEPGGVKLAVAEVIGESAKEDLPDLSVSLGSQSDAAQSILAEMKEREAEFKVLLAYMPMGDAITLAEKNPGFDLILCKSKYEESLNEEMRMVGNTMVTWVGQKGKKVGVVGYWRSGKPRLRFEMVPIDLRFKDVAAMNEIYARYVAAVQAGGFLDKMPKIPHPTKDTFVGAEKCKDCHKKAYEKWGSSRHAHAFDSLRKAIPAGQDYNPECVSCHATGFQYTSGFVSADLTPNLLGNQCENCHGPGAAHVNDPKNVELQVRMRKSQHAIKNDCMKCHDAENSIHFHFETYWEKVKHPWRD